MRKFIAALSFISLIAPIAVTAAPPAHDHSAKKGMVMPEVTQNPRVVFHAKSNDLNAQGTPMVFELAARLQGFYKSQKVPVEIVVVVQDDFSPWMLNDKAYKQAKKGEKNPASSQIQALIKDGVSIEFCMSDMQINKYTTEMLQPGVKQLMGALPRVIELQSKGWTYLAY